MKALLVAAAASDGSPALVASLAETHGLVIAVDGGGALCAEAGITPDVVVGDFDSIDSATLDRLARGGSEVISFPADKDQTDLELALTEARTRGATAVTVTAATGLRLDHTLASLAALAGAADLRPEVMEPTLSAWVLHPSGRRQLSVQGRGGTLSLAAWGATCIVSASGLKWLLEAHTLSPESALGVSNVITSDSADLVVHEGTLLVIAPQMPSGVRVCAL
jgi:thiamine pyrophosphokinase